MQMKSFKLLPLAAVLVAMTGCATQKTKDTEAAADLAKDQAVAEMNQARLPLAGTNVFIEDRAWIPSTTIEIKNEKVWDKAGLEVAFNNTYRTVSEFAGVLSGYTGVSFEVSPEVILMDEELNKSATATSVNGTTTNTMAMSLATSMMQTPYLKVEYKGNLSGLLNYVSAKRGIYWKVRDDGTVKLFKHETKTWRLSALLGNLRQKDAIDNGNSTSSINVQDLSIWKAIEDGVQSLLSAEGKLAVSEALGTVSVTDTPVILDRVNEYIDKQNKALSKTVLVNVQVYNVRFDDSEDYGIDWNAIYKSLSATSTGVTASLVNSTLAPTDAVNMSMGIIGSNSEWNGTSLLLKALSKRGKVTQITEMKQLTLNGQPVPFKAGTKTAYLKSSQTTISDGIATTTSEQGVVDSGFFLNIVPNVLDDDQNLLLQFAMNISTLDKIESVTSGDSTIQTPETSSREMIQRVRLKSGDTLVLTGYNVSELRSTLSGIGSADNRLGGSANSKDGRSMLVVLVQPIVGG